MKKTIKIIDLLVKIANGEEVPKKIKFRNALWIYSEENQDYLEYNKDDSDLFGYAFCNLKTLDFINDEVEILDEEEFEDIEEIETSYGGDCKHRIFESNGVSYEVSPTMKNKINQLIKNQKKIIERLKESE